MRALLKIFVVVICMMALALPASASKNTGSTNNNNTNGSGNNSDPSNPTGFTSSDQNDRPFSTINIIGDNDGYGFGSKNVGEYDYLPFTNDPVEGSGWLFDNREEDELNATNGAQGTDVEDFADVTFHHKFNIYDFEELTKAYFTIDIGGLQQGQFGGFSSLYIGGVEVEDFQNINQGTYGTGIFTYEVDIDMIRDGKLEVYFDNFGNDFGDDHWAIDFTMLSVKGTASNAVPEPTTMVLMGLGMAGMGLIRKYKK